MLAAGGVQAAVLVLISNGQIAFVVLFHTGMFFAAFDCVASIQLDGHIALALGGDSRTATVACINIHAGKGDICRLIFLGFDGDCIFGTAAAGLLDHRGRGLLLIGNAIGLADILAVIFGRHCNAAIGKIIFLGQDRQG